MSTMDQAGGSSESQERPASLKRKRTNSEDDLENMPPLKTAMYDPVVDEPIQNVVVESSSCSDEESTTESQSRALGFTDLDCDAVSIFSPGSVSDLPNGILSPLDNVARDSTPHSNKRKSKSDPQPVKRKCPLPPMSWGDPGDIWTNLCERDSEFALLRSHNMFNNHPTLGPQMRAILIDWLNEVSEVYKLHRESFHLAIEYFDRFLTNTNHITKERLQLIGITCLFIAAKVEEVYPPKIQEFAFVTDSACSVDEIILQELRITSVLCWNITPLTINGWLNLYLQLVSVTRNCKRRVIKEEAVSEWARAYTFTFPQYSSLEFVICGQLIDLVVLHVDVNKFAYSVVAAAVVAHVYGKDVAMRVSGFVWESLEACYTWCAPAIEVAKAAGGVREIRGATGGRSAGARWGAGGLSMLCPDLNGDDAHRLQVHNTTLQMYESFSDKLLEQCQESEGVSVTVTRDIYPLTPPPSDHKSPVTPSAHT